MYINQNIENCRIDSMGTKWMCKVNLARISKLNLGYNHIGDEGCFFLSKINMPYLEDIYLSIISSI